MLKKCIWKTKKAFNISKYTNLGNQFQYYDGK